MSVLAGRFIENLKRNFPDVQRRLKAVQLMLPVNGIGCVKAGQDCPKWQADGVVLSPHFLKRYEQHRTTRHLLRRNGRCFSLHYSL